MQNLVSSTLTRDDKGFIFEVEVVKQLESLKIEVKRCFQPLQKSAMIVCRVCGGMIK